ncbi:hypothetical protein LMIY3S_03551 [Labrys miyagiensis]
MADYYVSGPELGHDTLDRARDCESQLEPLFKIMMELAQSAGWGTQEVCHAFINLADNELLLSAGSTDVAAQIAAAIKRVSKSRPNGDRE